MVGLLGSACPYEFLENNLFLAINQPNPTSRAAPRIVPTEMPAFAPDDKPAEDPGVGSGVGFGAGAGVGTGLTDCEVAEPDI